MSHDLISAVEAVARVAGDVAMSYFGAPVDVIVKDNGSPVTVADREAERVARAWISARFPNDEIVGEELGVTSGSSRRRWYIDPIDGTQTFIRGVPLWGTLIGLAEGGDVLAGAIYCPAVAQMVVAERGQGCFSNGARTWVSPCNTLNQATILTTDARFASHPERAERWTALAAQVAVSRTWGDCYGYVLVAQGRAELMVDDRLAPWDAAALIPVIREAGGVYSDWRGSLAVDGGDGFAACATLADQFRAQLSIAAAL